MRVTPAGKERKQGCERRVSDGPDEHKKKLAGSPQDNGAVERLGSIVGPLSGLELDSKPSAAQRRQRYEASGVGSRAKRLTHQCRLPSSVAELKWGWIDSFRQAACNEGKERRRRGSAGWWKGDLDRRGQGEGTGSGGWGRLGGRGGWNARAVEARLRAQGPGNAGRQERGQCRKEPRRCRPERGPVHREPRRVCGRDAE